MPQQNTVSIAAKLPSADLANATSETAFKDSGGTNLLALWIPSSSKFLNKPFQIFVGGRAQSGTTSNFTAKVYFGNNATVTSNVAIATSGAVAMASAKHSWQMTISAQWDNDSQKIQGVFSGQMANAAIALAALSNAVTAVDLTAADTDYSAAVGATNKVIIVSGLFGTSNAANHAFVDFLEIQSD